MNIEQVQKTLKQFADDRDWEQFHSPKNLAMALSVEAAELLENFQWLTQAQSKSLASDQLEAVAQEVADVQIYLLMLADKLGIDIENAVRNKIETNAVKYPASNSPLVCSED